MYPPKDPDEAKAQINQDSAREIVDAIDRLIQWRIACADRFGNDLSDKAHDEQIEITKRQITDYLLVTDPRKGVFASPEPTRPTIGKTTTHVSSTPADGGGVN